MSMDKDLLVSCVDQGMSLNQLAKKFGKGQTTVRYWLKKYNLKTHNKAFGDGYSYSKRVSKDNQYCCSCKVKLTPENAYNRKTKGIYSSLCKKCHSRSTLKRRLKFKQKCVEYKGGSCIRCGYTKILTALEFHHRNPEDKEINPSKMMNKTPEFIENELDKCDLLCSNCHREVHYELNKRKSLEKNFNGNFVSSFSNFILTGKNTRRKSCNSCDIVLTEDNTAASSHNGSCKSCDSKNVVERGQKGKELAVEYMGGKCSICDYNKCINALEFHHLDPSKKSKTYNQSFIYWGFERQKKELENCIIVCGNCHREIHSKSEWGIGA